MPWAKSKPDPSKYHTPEHRAIRDGYKAQLQRDGYLICAQPVCVKTTRTITPGERWCAGHDETGTRYIGPVHWDCNNHDAAVRGNQNRHRPPQPRRWVL